MLRSSNKKGHILIDAIVGTAVLLLLSTALFMAIEVNYRNIGLNKQKVKSNEALDCIVKELKYNYTYDDLMNKMSFDGGTYRFHFDDINIDNLKTKELFSLKSDAINDFIELKISEDISKAFLNIKINLVSSVNGIKINKSYEMRKGIG